MPKKYHISLIILTLFVFLSSVQIAEAQNSILYFVPSQGSFTQGESFWVTIMVDTKGELINAVAVSLSYPEDKLEALGVNTDGSAMMFWAEKDAAAGKISLAGGKPTPGFSGYQKIASIGFKVKVNSGSVTLTFNNDSAVLSDATNQNILNLGQSGQGNYTFKPAAASTPVAEEQPPSTIQPNGSIEEEPEDSEPLDIGYQIEIIVLDTSNEQPIAGARVILPGLPELTGTTNQDGKIMFDNIPLGEQQITVVYKDISLDGIIEILPKEEVQRFDVKFKLPQSDKTLIIIIAGGIIAFIALIIIFISLRQPTIRPFHTNEENLDL